MKTQMKSQRFLAALLLGAALWALPALADRVTYLHVDALGSPSLATDENGTVLWREHYEPFGSRIEKVAASADNPLWFTGQEQDAQTGLVHMGERYYHPGFGRFLSVDPAPVSWENPHLFNRYSYANNNPYRYVDPQGELPIFVIAYGIYKVGSFAYDAYTTYETVNDPNATDAEKALAVGTFALGTIDPSGTASKVRIADRMIDTARAADRVSDTAKTSSRVTTDIISTKDGLVDVKPTLERIRIGGSNAHRNDGSVFKNKEGLLPSKPDGYYKEYVHPTPGVEGAGKQRIVQGAEGELYYTPDHYQTFVPIN